MAGAWQLTLPGVVESLGAFPCRPVGLIRTQKFHLFLNQNTHSVIESYKTIYRHKADVTMP